MSAPAKNEVRLTVRGAMREAMDQLLAAKTPSHGLAAELLLMHVTGRDRAWIYAHPEIALDETASQRFFDLVAQRASGMPTQYLTEKQEFWGMEFKVTPAVLIPRPETEHVIEVAVERLAASEEPHGAMRVADVGTGSGCIAVALARELPKAEIFATDISGAALEVARQNAERHGVLRRVHFAQCNLLDGVSRLAEFDLIASNPPYIGRENETALQREVREHEPPEALFGGPTGLEIYGRLAAQAAQHLCARGLLVMEMGYGAAERVRDTLNKNVWADIRVTNDLAGIPRVISAERR